MSPLTNAQKKANEKYLSKFVQIAFRVSKDQKEEIVKYARARGESLNAFIIRAINDAMESDKKKQ